MEMLDVQALPLEHPRLSGRWLGPLPLPPPNALPALPTLVRKLEDWWEARFPEPGDEESVFK